jgi:hypothetical protein
MKSNEKFPAQITEIHANNKRLEVSVNPLVVDVIEALEKETKHHLHISGESRTLAFLQGI